MRTDDDTPPKLSPFEVVGAWLGVWTPPRDARVPPVPWRALGLGFLAALVAGGGAFALIAPRIQDGKDARAAQAERERVARVERRRATLLAEQRAQVGSVAVRAGADARGAVLRRVERAIGADARERFHPRARRATCEPAPGADPAAPQVAYDCFSTIRDIVGAGKQTGARGRLAIPFRAVVDFPAGRYAFCKLNPVPGEMGLPDPRERVQLPRACQAPRAGGA